jgi:hypothetical protein
LVHQGLPNDSTIVKKIVSITSSIIKLIHHSQSKGTEKTEVQGIEVVFSGKQIGLFGSTYIRYAVKQNQEQRCYQNILNIH